MSLPITITKKCKKCGEEKSLDDFRNQRKTKDNKGIYCIPCTKEYAKQHYKKNKPARLVQIKKWNSDHPEKLKEYQKKWLEHQKEN